MFSLQFDQKVVRDGGIANCASTVPPTNAIRPFFDVKHSSRFFSNNPRTKKVEFFETNKKNTGFTKMLVRHKKWCSIC